jgi:pimeloyl-ACP methyl ester carboxylesterase
VRALARILLALGVLIAVLAIAVLGAFRWQAHARETKTRQEAAPRVGRFVRAADVEIFVQEAGPPGAPVVLFVHGMGAWSELWRETLTVTAAAGFRAVALDLPPFGFSERPAPGAYGRQAQARRILGVIDALGARHATLVGHSFGGGPTMEAVLLAPERVRGLVLPMRRSASTPSPVTAAPPRSSSGRARFVTPSWRRRSPIRCSRAGCSRSSWPAPPR